MPVQKFRKKPVVIEAIQYLRDKNINEIQDFFGDNEYKDGRIDGRILDYEGKDNEYYIRTLEGRMKLSRNDWIIKGVKGEFYPCKPDIFEATYELAEEDGHKVEGAEASGNVAL